MEFDRKKRLATAHHEAGHAIAAIRMGLGVSRVGIYPATTERTYSGECQPARQGDDFRYIVFVLAGLIAGRRFDGRASDFGASGDRAIIREVLSNRYRRTVVSLDVPIVRKARLQAESIVSENWPEVTAVANELMANIELSGDAVRDIAGRATLLKLENEIKALEEFV